MRIAAVALSLAALLAAPAALAEEPKPGGVLDGEGRPVPGARPAPREAPASTEELFYRAYYLETGLRDFEKAAAAYAEAVEAARTSDTPERLGVKSLLGRGRCLRTLGKLEEARAAFGKALEADPGNAEAMAALDAQPGRGTEEAIAAHIRTLVALLGTASHDNAVSQLGLLRGQAVPFLEEALRSRQVGTVDAVAELLGKLGSEASLGALARALSDRAVAFPEVVWSRAMKVEASYPTRAHLELAVGLLDSPSAEVRRNVVMRLATHVVKREYGAEALTPLLRRALGDPDPRVRIAALKGYWPDPSWEEAVPRIRELLEDGDGEVRTAAWGAARNRVVAVALREDLQKALRSEDPSLRRLAFLALSWAGLLPKEEEDAVLASFLASTDETGILTAVEGLINRLNRAPAITEPALVEAMLAALRNVGSGALSNETASRLMPPLTWGPPGIQDSLPLEGLVDAYAAFPGQGPSKLGPREAFQSRILDILVRRTAGPALGARDALTARGLKAIGDPAGRAFWTWFWARQNPLGRETLRVAAADASPEIRFMAYDQMVRFPWGKEERRPDLPRLVEDFRSPLLQAAVGPNLQYGAGNPHRVLALLLAKVWPDPAYAPGIRDVLADGAVPGNAVEAAVQALVACVGKEALPDLRSLHGRVGLNTIRSLFVDLLGPEAVPDLLRMVEAGVPADDVVRAGSGERAHLLVPKPVFAAFLKALPREKWSPALVSLVPENVEGEERDALVLEAIRSDRPPVQRAGARAAGVLALDRAWPWLVPLLDSPDPQVRTEARGALEVIRSARELRAAFERFGEGGPAKALEDARALLAHEDPVKRRAGALAIGALGDPAGVPALLPLLDDREPAVREAVLSALERLGGKK